MKTILVVDDEERIRNIYLKVLTREGFRVLAAADAEAAYEILLHYAVDLILLDVNMPEVDGGVFYNIIEAFIHKTKVIVASVYSVENQKMHIKGATDYYDKSDSISSLVQKIQACISEQANEKKGVIQ